MHAVNRILTRLKDKTNKIIYLEFLNSVLPYIHKLTLIFQRESPEIHNLFTEVSSLFQQFADFCCISVDPKNLSEILKVENLLPKDQVYIGLIVEMKINELPKVYKMIFIPRFFNKSFTGLISMILSWKIWQARTPVTLWGAHHWHHNWSCMKQSYQWMTLKFWTKSEAEDDKTDALHFGQKFLLYRYVHFSFFFLQLFIF